MVTPVVTMSHTPVVYFFISSARASAFDSTGDRQRQRRESILKKFTYAIVTGYDDAICVLLLAR